MRTKATTWFDADRHKAVYGIAVLNKDGKWSHVARKNDAGLYCVERYDTEEERDKLRAELRKSKWD